MMAEVVHRKTAPAASDTQPCCSGLQRSAAQPAACNVQTGRVPSGYV